MSSWRPPGPQGDNRCGGPAYPGRNKTAPRGGPSGVQRSSASSLQEAEALFTTYEHLSGLPRGDSALIMLRKIASVVKPIMRKRGWKVQVLAEFLPPEQNLLGLNINKGYKICIRLRYHNNPDLFLPFEECVDTMLHELSHNVWGAHDSNFHKLWDELRDEHEVLVRKGYTGEGFLGIGNRLGGAGAGWGRPQLSAHELRRLARDSAEKRAQQGTLGIGSGQRLGGNPIHRAGQDIRSVIADQIIKRNNNNKSMKGGGCASGREDAAQLSQEGSTHTFKTQAEEDDANNRAIAQALFELMEQEEERKLNGMFAGSKAHSTGGLGWTKENGLYHAGQDSSSQGSANGSYPSEEDQLKWAMEESVRGSSEVPEMPSSPRADCSVLAGENPSSSSTDRTIVPPPQSSRGKAGSSMAKPSIPAQVSTTRKRPASALRASPAKASSRHVSSGTQSALIDSTACSGTTATPDQQDLVPAEDDSMDDRWACEICTCINPLEYLTCDACGIERSQTLLDAKETTSHSTTSNARRKAASSAPRNLDLRPLPTMTAAERFPIKAPDPNASLGWKCSFCGSFMEHKWWTCSACGTLKDSS